MGMELLKKNTASARLTADSSREAHMAQRMSREFVRKA